MIIDVIYIPEGFSKDFFLAVASMQVCGGCFLNGRQHGCRLNKLARLASSTRARGSGDRAGCGSRRSVLEETRAAAAWRTSSSQQGMCKIKIKLFNFKSSNKHNPVLNLGRVKSIVV